MAYIKSNSRPIDAKTYATADDAVASLRDPIHVRDNLYRSMGAIYEIVEGDNPKAATPTSAPSSVASGSATPAQWRYLNDLSRQVPESAYAHWVKPGLTKDQASRAINALKTIASR